MYSWGCQLNLLQEAFSAVRWYQAVLFTLQNNSDFSFFILICLRETPTYKTERLMLGLKCVCRLSINAFKFICCNSNQSCSSPDTLTIRSLEPEMPFQNKSLTSKALFFFAWEVILKLMPYRHYGISLMEQTSQVLDFPE